MRAVLEIIKFYFQILKDKRLLLMKICFIGHASRILLPDGWKFAINHKNDNEVVIFRYDVITFFFLFFDVSVFL